jgi:hypothetical protein
MRYPIGREAGAQAPASTKTEVTTMSDEKLKDPSRRNLIKGVGVVATIGVLAGATGRVVGKEVLTHDTEPDKGYRETPHVHDFYRTLRGTD